MKNKFTTKKEAVEFLDSINWLVRHSNGKNWYSKGVYYPSNNEYEIPYYCPVRYADGWGIHCTYFCYIGAINPRQSGRISDDDFINWVSLNGQ